MRQSQFTVRRLMGLVAIIGIGLGGCIEVSRLIRVSAARRREAASYAASMVLARKYAHQYSQRAEESKRVGESSRSSDLGFLKDMEIAASMAGSMAARYRRNADHWAMMNQKYERAARWPWFSVEPDPAPPMD